MKAYVPVCVNASDGYTNAPRRQGAAVMLPAAPSQVLAS